MDELPMRLKPSKFDIGVSCISITPERELSFADSFPIPLRNSPCHRSEETGLLLHTLHAIFLKPCIVDDHWCYRFYLWGHWRIFHVLEHGENESSIR
ncbi:hypothetical protein O9929_17700 [Vibrio lentus]|nr:hypothetical protein [Vibrio lentus]